MTNNMAPPEQLRSLVERIENLNEEKDGVSQQIAEVYAEAKSQGFNKKILRIVVQRRKMQRNDRDEQDELVRLYQEALEK